MYLSTSFTMQYDVNSMSKIWYGGDQTSDIKHANVKYRLLHKQQHFANLLLIISLTSISSGIFIATILHKSTYSEGTLCDFDFSSSNV